MSPSPNDDNSFVVPSVPEGVNVQNVEWERAVDRLHYAFQPIVNVHTGATYGYEALLRGWDDAGFSCIHELFDRAHDELILHQLDVRLRAKAVESFVKVPHHQQTRLS